MSGKTAGSSSGVLEHIYTEMGMKYHYLNNGSDPFLAQNVGGSNLNVGSHAKATKNNGSHMIGRKRSYTIAQNQWTYVRSYIGNQKVGIIRSSHTGKVAHARESSTLTV